MAVLHLVCHDKTQKSLKNKNNFTEINTTYKVMLEIDISTLFLWANKTVKLV